MTLHFQRGTSTLILLLLIESYVKTTIFCIFPLSGQQGSANLIFSCMQLLCKDNSKTVCKANQSFSSVPLPTLTLVILQVKLASHSHTPKSIPPPHNLCFLWQWSVILTTDLSIHPSSIRLPISPLQQQTAQAKAASFCLMRVQSNPSS